MKLYLDTSVLICAFTEEAETERIQQWLQDQAADTLLISEWVIAEFSATLSIKLRTKTITTTGRSRALAAFQRLCVEVFDVAPVQTQHFHRSARLADQDSIGLRAGDALHLAVAEEAAALLCTLDRRLAQSGLRLGLKTQLL